MGTRTWAIELGVPLSEIFGRKPAVLIPYFPATISSFVTGTAEDVETIVIGRSSQVSSALLRSRTQAAC